MFTHKETVRLVWCGPGLSLALAGSNAAVGIGEDGAPVDDMEFPNSGADEAVWMVGLEELSITFRRRGMGLEEVAVKD